MRNPDNAIEVTNIKKTFKIYYDKSNQLKERLLFKNRNKYEVREVLKGISFEVKKGEAIGIIGQNGCGKSTTLKLLTKIMYPDSGEIEIKGRVSSLIELGAGFHPDMSGRENIYTNAAIFGLNKKEIDRRLEEIIRFSELEDFIDNPVRTYSSGMYMRLAFSVAINVNADVLLVDEILAVGDVNFQQKCFDKLKEIKANGTTVVIVSHSLSQIEQICERSMWIENGAIKAIGIPKFIHEEYLSQMEKNRINRAKEEEEEKKETNNQNDISNTSEEHDIEQKSNEIKEIRMGNKKVEIEKVYLLNNKKEITQNFYSEEDIMIEIFYKNNSDIKEGNFGIGIYRDDGLYCYGTNVDIEFGTLFPLTQKGKVTIILPKIKLIHGVYFCDVAIHSKDSLEVYDDIRNSLQFQIYLSKRDDGLYRMQSRWFLDDQEWEKNNDPEIQANKRNHTASI